MPAVRILPDLPPDNRTLGWQVLEWMIDHLVHGVTGEPLELTNEGIDFVLCAYAVDDNGRWLYDRAALRRARGTGKSPLAAALACAELCGPVRFGGWDDNGYPIGVPEPAPWVQVIAITMEQTKPIMDIARASFSDAAIGKYGLTIGIEAIVKAHPVDGGGPGRLAAIANNPRALRGPRPTAVFADEVSEWIASNGGHAAMIRINSNLAKNPGGRARLFEFCNAYEPGLDSHAEQTYAAYAQQIEAFGVSRILYDNLEADPALKLTDQAELEEAIRQAAGDAYWLDVERLVNQARDTGTSPTTFRREHLNQILSDDDSLISMPLFDELGQNVRPLEVDDAVTLGFDGSLSGDGTALVAFRLEDRSFHLLEYWEPPAKQDPNSPKWRIDEEMVDAHFRAYMETLYVVAAACDVHPFESWVYAWEKDYGDKLEAKASPAGNLIRDNRSDQRGLTYLCEALVNEIESKKIRFSSTLSMRMHWANAKRRLNRWGFSFGKITKSSTKRVDIVAASLMAYSAAMALAKDFNPKKKPKPARVHKLQGGPDSW
jgi:hypothetical protein